MKRFALIAPLFALLAIGCHAQIPATSYVVDLTWTAPVASGTWAGCTTTAPCAYVASRLALAAGTTTCPAPTTVAPFNYTPLNTASPVSAAAYTDSTASGLTVCYVVQTVQTQPGSTTASASLPSAPTAPLVVPASPLAPGSVTGTPTVSAEAPAPAVAPATGNLMDLATVKLTPSPIRIQANIAKIPLH
jgi:hypothetical protein